MLRHLKSVVGQANQQQQTNWCKSLDKVFMPHKKWKEKSSEGGVTAATVGILCTIEEEIKQVCLTKKPNFLCAPQSMQQKM